jgi:hypothetical protein
MDEIAEAAAKFVGGVAKQVVMSAFQDELQEEFDEHPAEQLGKQVGHAIGGTIATLATAFSDDNVG